MKSRSVEKFLIPITAFFVLVVCQTLPVTKSLPAGTTRAQSKRATTSSYGTPRTTGKLKSPEINESSGLVAAQTAGFYWTNNDSGDGPNLYAIDETGASRGVWRVAGASARDWEDIAAGPGPQSDRRYLYIGDIGDNDEKRQDIIVYRIPEPVITARDIASTKRNPRATETAEAIKLKYPDGRHDAETLMIHPSTGDLYIVSKLFLANPVVYKASAPLRSNDTVTLVKQGELNLPSLLGGILTGGSLSPDGRRVAFCDYVQGYELVQPATSRNFDDIWKQPISIVNLGKRPQGEAIAYRLDGRALLASSEGLHSPLVQVLRR
jgi:hypothetical protein